MPQATAPFVSSNDASPFPATSPPQAFLSLNSQLSATYVYAISAWMRRAPIAAPEGNLGKPSGDVRIGLATWLVPCAVQQFNPVCHRDHERNSGEDHNELGENLPAKFHDQEMGRERQENSQTENLQGIAPAKSNGARKRRLKAYPVKGYEARPKPHMLECAQSAAGRDWSCRGGAASREANWLLVQISKGDYGSPRLQRRQGDTR